MSDNQPRLESLRARLIEKETARKDISEALLDPDHSKDEVKSLLDRGAALDLEIEALQTEIRGIEFPDPTEPGQPINPWTEE